MTDDDNQRAPLDASGSAGSGETPSSANAEPDGVDKVVTTLPVDHFGTTVYLKGWRQADSTNPPIIIVHDLGEHIDLYRETAYAFLANGYNVYCFDLRGHGRSGRRLGHAPRFNILVKDLLQVAAWVRHKEDGRLPIILGHGIGGLITNEFTRAHGAFCRAVVLSAPCLDLNSEISAPSAFALRFLADWFPTFRIPPRLAPKFARDLKHARSDTDDGAKVPYFPRLTAGFTQELLSAIQRSRADFIEYHGSVLILCPDLDPICDYTATRKAAAIHDKNNLQVTNLPGIGHNLFTEADATRDAALAIILPWLAAIARGRSRSEPRLDLRIEGASKEDIPMSKARDVAEETSVE